MRTQKREHDMTTGRSHWLASLLFILSLTAAAAPTVDVASRATSGVGTEASPWRGWETTTAWIAETEYFFRSGYYAYNVSPNFLKTGIALKGEAGTVLQFNGTGNAVVFDNPGGVSPIYRNWTMNVRMENFIIQGNPNATNGLFLRAIRNGIFRHISVRDVTNAGVWAEALVTNVFDNIRVTMHEMPDSRFNVVPSYGIVLGTRFGVGGDSTTTTTVTNAVIEGVSQIGIWIKKDSFANTFVNGTSETNLGKGMVIDGFSNTVINMVFEGNGGTNVEINDANNELQGVVSEGLVDVRNGYLNKLRGRFSEVTISNRCDYTDLSGSMITVRLNDQSQTTIKFGYFLNTEFRNDSLAGNVTDVMLSLPVVNGQIATDARRGKLFSAVLAANTMLADPTNGADGQRITWRFQQDSVGGRTLTFGSTFVLSSGEALPLQAMNPLNPVVRVAPTLNPAPLSFTEISARFNAVTNKWYIQ